MNQDEADERLEQAETLANKLNAILMTEGNFLVRYLAVSLIFDTMKRVIPEEHQRIVEGIVSELNESVVIQKRIKFQCKLCQYKFDSQAHPETCPMCHDKFEQLGGDDLNGKTF